MSDRQSKNENLMKCISKIQRKGEIQTIETFIQCIKDKLTTSEKLVNTENIVNNTYLYCGSTMDNPIVCD